jgi:hypothetical protein
MGVFNLLKKSFSAGSRPMSIEELLSKAAVEPVYRAEFCQRLLTENLYIITARSEIPKGSSVLQKGANLSVVSFPDGKIPVFTSTDRIFDKNVIQEQVEYVSMKGRDLFTTIKGSTVLLNPYSDYGKELFPSEIERLLDGSIFTDHLQTIQFDKATEVLIGQPAEYPAEMIDSLKTLFAEKKYVKSASLGWIHDPNSGDPPHYLIGIDTDHEMKTIVNEAGFTAKQHLAVDDFVDFIKVGNGIGLDRYFHTVKPFYTRAK